MVVNPMLPVLRIMCRKLPPSMFLVDVMMKIARTFACVLRPVIGTVGMRYYINTRGSQGQAMGARSRAPAKGRYRPFLPALKRYLVHRT